MDLEKLIKDYHENGYAVLPNCLNEDEVTVLLDECKKLVDGFNHDKNRVVFKTNLNELPKDRLIDSADKISFFYEADAFDKEGNFKVDKSISFNKIGHALHWLNPVFKEITFSEKVKSIAKALSLVEPKIVQSMIIFKNPGIGGEVDPDQDATFLYTSPEIKLHGIWFALEDVTIDNGCLSFVPGSHKKPGPLRRFVRNSNGNLSFVFSGVENTYSDEEFVPVLVPKGSCVLIHGLVVHKSSHNFSAKGRPVYTFHIIDNNGVNYDEANWLQPTSELDFPSLYAN